MNCSRLLAFVFLLCLTSVAPGQTTLFSTATTAPATNKPAAGPRPIDVAASGGHTLTLTNNQALRKRRDYIAEHHLAVVETLECDGTSIRIRRSLQISNSPVGKVH